MQTRLRRLSPQAENDIGGVKEGSKLTWRTLDGRTLPYHLRIVGCHRPTMLLPQGYRGWGGERPWVSRRRISVWRRRSEIDGLDAALLSRLCRGLPRAQKLRTAMCERTECLGAMRAWELA